MAEPDEAPGWDAIKAALAREHGPGEPAHHFATLLPQRVIFGGPEVIDGVSVYRVARPAHWHLVTFGLSELYAKASDDPAVSGWGFELTMRVPRHDDDQAPLWALGLLQGIANQSHAHARRHAVGDRVNVEGPIIGQTTALTALLMAEDPHLGTIDTPHGRLQFLQLVGITADELAFAQRAGSAELLARLRGHDPLLQTDLERGSVLEGRRLNGRAQADDEPRT